MASEPTGEGDKALVAARTTCPVIFPSKYPKASLAAPALGSGNKDSWELVGSL